MWIKPIIFSFFLFFNGLFMTLFAQDTLSMEESIQMALENNYGLQIERSRMQVAETEKAAGRAAFMPALRLDGGADRRIEDTDLDFVDGGGLEREGALTESFNGAAIVEYRFFDGFRMFADYNQLKALEDVSIREYELGLQSTVSEVMNTYLELLKAIQNKATAEKTVALSRKRLNFEQNRFELGAGAKTELLAAKVDFNSDTSDYIKQQESIDELKIMLNQLMGRSVMTPFEVQPETPIDLDEEVDYESLKTAMTDNHPELSRQQRLFESAMLERQAVRSGFYPTLDFNFGTRYNQLESEAGFVARNQTQGVNYGLNVQWNLFNGFMVRRQQQIADLNIEIAGLQIQEATLGLEADLATAYRIYENNLILLRLEEENLSTAAENQDIAFENYELGNISYLALREAQNNYVQAENRFYEIRYTVKENYVRLMELSGVLLKSHSN